MFSLSIVYERKEKKIDTEKEKDVSIKSSLEQIGKMLFHVDTSVLTKFAESKRYKLNVSTFVRLREERKVIPKDNKQEQLKILKTYIAPLQAFLNKLNNGDSKKMQYFIDMKNAIQKINEPRKNPTSKNTELSTIMHNTKAFREAMERVFANNDYKVINNMLESVKEKIGELRELKSVQSNSERFKGLEKFRREKGTYFRELNEFKRKIKLLISITYPFHDTSVSLWSYIKNDDEKMKEIENVKNTKIAAILTHIKILYADKNVSQYVLSCHKASFINKDEEEEEEEDEEEDAEYTESLKIEENISVLGEKIAKFKEYDFSVTLSDVGISGISDEMYQKRLKKKEAVNNDFTEWLLSRHDFYESFRKFFLRISFIKSVLAILRISSTLKIFDIKVDNVKITEDLVIDHVQKLKKIIFKNIFNGLTKLKIIQGGTSDILLKIDEKKNLIVGKNDPGASIKEYVIFPYHRFEHVTLRISLDNANFFIFGIFPRIEKLIDIQYNSPLINQGISYQAQLHFGRTTQKKDLDSVIFAYLQKNIIASKFPLSDHKEFMTSDSLITLKDYSKTNPSKYYQSLFSLSSETDNEKSLQSKFSLFNPDMHEFYLKLDLRMGENRLIKMNYKEDEDTRQCGMLSFEMHNDNSFLTTFTTQQIMNMWTPKKEKEEAYFQSLNQSENISRHVLDVKNARIPKQLAYYIKRKNGRGREHKESMQANDLSKKFFWPRFIASLYSYFVNYGELERDKNNVLKYDINENNIYEGSIDDWLSACHTIEIHKESTEKPPPTTVALLTIYSTFSMSRGILRLKIQSIIMTIDYFEELIK
jgi:hypothetical protein